jgi:hypothetical protein
MAVAAKGRHCGLQPRMLLLLLLVGPDLDPSENHSNHIYEFPTSSRWQRTMVVPTATVIRLNSRHPWKFPDMPCTEAHPDPEMAAARPVVQVFGCSESWQIVGKSVFRGRFSKRRKVEIAAYLLVI